MVDEMSGGVGVAIVRCQDVKMSRCQDVWTGVCVVGEMSGAVEVIVMRCQDV